MWVYIAIYIYMYIEVCPCINVCAYFRVWVCIYIYIYVDILVCRSCGGVVVPQIRLAVDFMFTRGLQELAIFDIVSR